jgi:hypothetical protein
VHDCGSDIDDKHINYTGKFGNRGGIEQIRLDLSSGMYGLG